MQFHVDETVEGRAGSETWGTGGGNQLIYCGRWHDGWSPRYPPSGDNRIDKRADILVHVRRLVVTIAITIMRWRLQ